MIMKSTESKSPFFLNVLFSTFTWIVPLYRKAEKTIIQIHKKKKMEFLKKCFEEKVIPKALNWVKRLDMTSPFPAEAKKVLQKEIEELKDDIDTQYYQLRHLKSGLLENLPDGIGKAISPFLKKIGIARATKKEAELDEKLRGLIEASPWTTSCPGDNIVNFSSYDLSANQKQVLGYGLNFSLPHEKSHFFSVLEELEKLKRYGDDFNHSFLLMNLENIFYDLKNEVKEFLPKRFFIALKELKNKKKY